MSEALPSTAVIERRYPVSPVPVTDPNWKCPVTEVRYPVLEFNRFPVSQETIAAFVGSGREASNRLESEFRQELHQCISAMVHGLAFKYAVNCRLDEPGDMVQDCWVRIMEKIHTYTPARARFTTWAYHVCKSVLNRSYRKGKRYHERYTDMPDGIADNQMANDDSRAASLGSDVRNAVRELLNLYPARSGVIVALLGKPDSEIIPHEIDVHGAASVCGVPDADVEQFYKEVIRPFFERRFSDEATEQEEQV